MLDFSSFGFRCANLLETTQNGSPSCFSIFGVRCLVAWWLVGSLVYVVVFVLASTGNLRGVTILAQML